jgi:hypothetical protein
MKKILIALLILGSPGLGQHHCYAATSASTVGTASTQSTEWKNLSPAEKENLRKSYNQFNSLPDAQKKDYEQKYKQYMALSPAEKKKVEDNYAKFQQLPAAKQEQLRKNFERFSKLSPEERQKRIDELEAVREARRQKHEAQEEKKRKVDHH